MKGSDRVGCGPRCLPSTCYKDRETRRHGSDTPHTQSGHCICNDHQTLPRGFKGPPPPPPLTPAPMWMNLEDTVLRELSHSRKDTSGRVPLMGGT